MDYWKKRTIENEAYANRIAKKYVARQKRLLWKSLKDIKASFNELYTDIASDNLENITRTQLWQYSKYKELEEQIRNELQLIGKSQITDIEKLTEEVFEKTLETNLNELLSNSKHYSFNTKQLMRLNVNSLWSGENYSTRVWKNTNTLANRLLDDINAMITLGKSPNAIKQALINDFKIGYNAADRLIRTESAYVFNQANKTSYKEAGIKYVKYLPERDGKLCEQCRELADRYKGIYQIDEVPQLPVHPCCRCCYTPIVYLTNNTNKDNIKVPKDMLRQTDEQLEKGIKSSLNKIDEHEEKLLNPESFYDDWKTTTSEIKEKRINHWKKEIRTFNSNIAAVLYELSRRKK